MLFLKNLYEILDYVLKLSAEEVLPEVRISAFQDFNIRALENIELEGGKLVLNNSRDYSIVLKDSFFETFQRIENIQIETSPAKSKIYFTLTIEFKGYYPPDDYNICKIKIHAYFKRNCENQLFLKLFQKIKELLEVEK